MHCDIDLAVRLAKRKQILDLIDRRRESECDAGIGWAIEQRILSEELLPIHMDMREQSGIRPALHENSTFEKLKVLAKRTTRH